MRIVITLFILASALLSFCQTEDVTVISIVSDDGKQSFPEVYYSTDPYTEFEINNYLQMTYLQIIQDEYFNHPFEMAEFDKKDGNSYKHFLSWKQFNTPEMLLSLEIKGHIYDIHSESFTDYIMFDLYSGHPVVPKKLLAEEDFLIVQKLFHAQLSNTINKFLSESEELRTTLNKETDGQELNAKIEMYQNCLAMVKSSPLEDSELYISGSNIHFVQPIRTYNAFRDVNELLKFDIVFTFDELKTHFSRYGRYMLLEH